MKKLIFLLLILIPILTYAQSDKIKESIQIRNEMIDSISKLNTKIILIGNKLRESDSADRYNYKVLGERVETINKNIDDGRLRESLKSSESTINKLDTIVDTFAVIYGIISIIVILLTVGLPVYTVYINNNMRKEVKDSITDAQNLQKNILNDHNILKAAVEMQISTFNKEKESLFREIKNELNIKFEEFLEKNKKQQIDQALINLSVEETEFKDPAISFLNLTAISYFEDDHLFKIYKLIKRTNLDFGKKLCLVKILSEIKSDYSEELFLGLPQDPTINNKEIRTYGYLYFAKNNISNYEEVCTKLVIESENPTEEYINLLQSYSSNYFDSSILTIINWSVLNRFKEIRQDEIINIIKAFPFYYKKKEEIDQSLLFKASTSK